MLDFIALVEDVPLKVYIYIYIFTVDCLESMAFFFSIALSTYVS